jgi:hypothetical protein
VRRALAAALAVLAAACGGQRPDPATLPPTSVAPMDLGGQRVLILPIQASAGLPVNREEATLALVAALRDRDSRTQWVDPARLRRSLAQSPGFAPDPAALPGDPYRTPGDRRIQGPLADAVRRYSALTEARLVLIPRSAVVRALPEGGVVVRMDAAVVDARTGLVVWFGEAEGGPGAADDPALVTTAVAALAARLVVPDSR